VTGLARCVGDVPWFLEQHWGRAPLHRVAADESGFDDLFSLDDVDRLVSSSFARLPAFRLVRNGKPVEQSRYTKSARIGGQTVSGVGDPRKVFDELRAGATIVLQGLQRYWPPLARFCRSLELELTHPVQANAYVTPAGAQGLAVHYDTHDVFVLQVSGGKEWAVHEPVLEAPLPSQPWSANRGSPGPPGLSPKMREGDVLYMPRGFLHSAQAQEDLSVHLTIGVLTTTWHDVLKDVIAAAAGDLELRRSLPAGFAHDEDQLVDGVHAAVARLRRVLDEVDAEAVAGTVTRRFWASRPPILAGQLRQLLLVDRLRDASVLRRRDGAICHLRVEEDVLRLELGDREVRMPSALEPAVGRVLRGDRFPLATLGDLLDEQSRVVFARRLVEEGLLEIVAVDGD
jgi:hypothetical protein